MRDCYPKARIVILGDIGNGQEDAERAARTTGALLALPDFGGDRPEGCTEFNNMACQHGPEAVRAALEVATRVDAELESIDVAVERLAALKPLRYERVRELEAEALGVRVSALDKEVAKARNSGGAEAKGRAIELYEPEPWPEPA